MTTLTDAEREAVCICAEISDGQTASDSQIMGHCYAHLKAVERIVNAHAAAAWEAALDKFDSACDDHGYGIGMSIALSANPYRQSVSEGAEE